MLTVKSRLVKDLDTSLCSMDYFNLTLDPLLLNLNFAYFVMHLKFTFIGMIKLRFVRIREKRLGLMLHSK
jgi:hypothetical protein